MEPRGRAQDAGLTPDTDRADGSGDEEVVDVKEEPEERTDQNETIRDTVSEDVSPVHRDEIDADKDSPINSQTHPAPASNLGLAFPAVHARVDPKQTPFRCSTCGKSFSKKNNLLAHSVKHNADKPFSCPVCPLHFPSKLTAENHTLDHLREDTNKHPCPECDKKFSWKSHLQIHMRVHTGEKPFSCAVCGKSFTKKSNLSNHQRFHIGTKPFHCANCDVGFAQKSSLASHMTLHDGDKTFTCSVCQENFKSLQTIQRHTKKNHAHDSHFPSFVLKTDDRLLKLSGKSKRSCPECGKAFERSSNLERHMSVHTGQRPFSCSVCGLAFARKSYLHEHASVHTGEKPYSCSFCQKTFRLKNNLNAHVATHTGARRFQCPVCGAKFTLKSHLNRPEISFTMFCLNRICLHFEACFHKALIVKIQIRHGTIINFWSRLSWP